MFEWLRVTNLLNRFTLSNFCCLQRYHFIKATENHQTIDNAFIYIPMDTFMHTFRMMLSDEIEAAYRLPIALLYCIIYGVALVLYHQLWQKPIHQRIDWSLIKEWIRFMNFLQIKAIYLISADVLFWLRRFNWKWSLIITPYERRVWRNALFSLTLTFCLFAFTCKNVDFSTVHSKQQGHRTHMLHRNLFIKSHSFLKIGCDSLYMQFVLVLFHFDR